jgi:hypothetical protein
LFIKDYTLVEVIGYYWLFMNCSVWWHICIGITIITITNGECMVLLDTFDKTREDL